MSAATLAVRHCGTEDVKLSKGDHVIVDAGVLKGLEGILTDFRDDGRALIALGRGAYLELQHCHLTRRG